MLLHKLKLPVLTRVFLGAIASGAGFGFVGQASVRQAGKQLSSLTSPDNPRLTPPRL